MIVQIEAGKLAKRGIPESWTTSALDLPPSASYAPLAPVTWGDCQGHLGFHANT
jgi:hypothetical protein